MLVRKHIRIKKKKACEKKEFNKSLIGERLPDVSSVALTAPRGLRTDDFITNSFAILDWRDNEAASCTFKDSRHITATI